MIDEFTLEARVDGAWKTIATDNNPTDLLDITLTNDWKAKRYPGHRIFKSDRKRLRSGELAGGPPLRSSKTPAAGVIDISRQVELAVAWIEKSGIKTIRVYPLGKTSSHTSNQFRLQLFSKLLGISKTWPNNSDRVKTEALAVKSGYTIIEVDPDDFLGKITFREDPLTKTLEAA